MNRSGAIAVATFLTIACGHMEATPQLKQANAAYQEAAQGPAAQYGTSQLAEAKTSLEQANAALETGDRNLVDDKAALATSKIALADSVGKTNQAAAQRDATLKDLELAKERQARAAAESQAAQYRKDLEHYVRVQEEARGTVITLSGGVLFKSGKTELQPAAKEQLSRVAVFLQNSPRPVLIEGYSDSHGSASANRALSEKRAQAVADYLTSQGVAVDRIRVVGKGEESPVASNSTSSGRAQNRRVEITLEPATGMGGSAAPGSEPVKPDAPVAPPTNPR